MIIEYVNRDGKECKITVSCENTDKTVERLESKGCVIITWYDK